MINKSDIIISTDKKQLNIPFIHAFITGTYWAKGRTIQEVETTIDNCLCFGVYYQNKQIGFARILTDEIVFGYLMDVFISPPFQGQGISKMLMNNILKHPIISNLEKILLKTKDAHGLYQQFGFEKITDGGKFMIR